jgi:hypothetical protein
MCAGPPCSPATSGFNQLAFLAGPTFKVLKSSRVNVPVMALFGVVRGSVDRFEGSPFAYNIDTTIFAARFGGSVDFTLHRRMAIRVVEPSLFLRSQEPRTSFQLSTGLIFRLVK